jgi:hypothetical protein
MSHSGLSLAKKGGTKKVPLAPIEKDESGYTSPHVVDLRDSSTSEEELTHSKTSSDARV